MYTKSDYKKDIITFINKNGYDASLVAKRTYEIFMSHQRNIDEHLYDLLLDISNMDMGDEFELTEADFISFLNK
jgi:hypothetical protein